MPTVVVVQATAPIAVVKAAPARVAVTQSGPPGPAGADGATLDFEHVQSDASTEWIVNHNLGVEPLVTVLTPGGVEMEANIVHVSVNQVRIYFASAQTGRVRCI